MNPELQKQIQIARKLVKRMPPWKRNILIQSAKPTMSKPRQAIERQKNEI